MMFRKTSEETVIFMETNNLGAFISLALHFGLNAQTNELLIPCHNLTKDQMEYLKMKIGIQIQSSDTVLILYEKVEACKSN